MLELTIQSFDRAVQSGIVFIDWWAAWCGPCRAFAPVFERAQARHPDVQFAKVNTEAEPELAARFGISAIPTLMVFRDGIQVFEQAGALPPAALDRLVQIARDLDMDEVRRELAAAPAASPA
ncbi:MAG TPA: thioredoxin [Kofleriaceae bacterium]|nr:thioredoxin [Kofleriaceae bacterium]